MPVKIAISTEEDIINIKVPTKTGRTTIVPYGDIINKIKHSLQSKDLFIKKEEYRTTATGNIVTGLYIIEDVTKPKDHLGYTLSWSYSYDKTQRFKCASGVENILSLDNPNPISNNIMDIFNEIEKVILSLENKYDSIESFGSKLEVMQVSKRKTSHIIGELFIDSKLVNLTQLGIIKREVDSTEINTVWDLFNTINNTLTESHPTTWLIDHTDLYHYFSDNFYNLKIDNKYKDTTEYLLSSPANKKRLEESISEMNYTSDLNTVVFL